MYTLHHGFWIYFFTRRHPRVWQFVAGSMLPDYIYLIMAGVLVARGELTWTDFSEFNPRVLMALVPLYPWVEKVDLIGHSVVIWGIAFCFSLSPVFSMVRAFVIGWGSHLLLDAVTHGAYANYYLYPLSMSVVHSPVSYWEPQYLAREFKLVNGTLMVFAGGYLVYRWWREKKNK